MLASSPYLNRPVRSIEAALQDIAARKPATPSNRWPRPAAAFQTAPTAPSAPKP